MNRALILWRTITMIRQLNAALLVFLSLLREAFERGSFNQMLANNNRIIFDGLGSIIHASHSNREDSLTTL